jgi:hypothetical protein
MQRVAKKISEKQSTKISKGKAFRKERKSVCVDSIYSETKHPNLDKGLIFKLRKSIGA